MNFTLMDLLKRALAVGALEVKLVPGRRTIVVLPQGESEVKGDPQTPERINELLAPVMTPEAKRGLHSGWAEWEFSLDGRGPVRVGVEIASALARLYGQQFKLEDTAPLLGSKATVARIRAGEDPAAMAAAWGADEATWRVTRAKYLLY